MRCTTYLVAALFLGAGAGPLAAQGGRRIRVQGVQTLSFGNLLPGVPGVVGRTDPARSGRFDIVAPSNGQILVQFTLPNRLDGPAGAGIPLTFGGGDAGFSADQSIGGQIGFDPRVGFTAATGRRRRSSVFLGGRAQPSAGQRAGSYTAVVTLTVANVL